MNYGLLYNVVALKEHVFGKTKFPKIVLQPNGNWLDYLPDYEPQFGDGWDTFACPAWGTLNAIEILDRRLFKKDSNYSDRFLTNLVPIRPPGGDPHLAAEAIRRYGLVEESEMPFTKTFEEYSTPYPMTEEMLAKGRIWLEKYDFGHEWVWSGNPSHEKRVELLKEALKYSPIGISVSAWKFEKGVYIDAGKPNNHWCDLVAFIDIAGESYPYVFDTYDQKLKILSKDHKIERAKRYFLREKVKKTRPLWITSLLKLLHRVV